jgi:hypothetical protein
VTTTDGVGSTGSVDLTVFSVRNANRNDASRPKPANMITPGHLRDSGAAQLTDGRSPPGSEG